ncbi:Bestrophin-3 [Hypsibius exemplaris]|uniref:Bestrophin homolog n=1 Tax=Hypsibius exemplaris TaxID=2072580 RepID=A0A1W0WAE8_HYPEX|nr:Bestrophin-3 [Hypsibius exemplaris]
MTISYQLSVANATFAGFPKLLIRWKGSVYKLMFKELLVFSVLYTTVSLVYRLALTDGQRRIFERFCIHVDETINHVPLTFVLGFYVSFVVSRWWEQLVSYPWPDRMLYLIGHYIPGKDERSRMLRRALARYLNASTILLARSLSVVSKKRFPTLEHVVDAGLLTAEELKMYNAVQLQYGKFWIPLVWFTQLVDQARAEGLVHDPSGMGTKQLLNELMAFRTSLGKMFMYDWVSIPVSYTQVVTLATYTYFLGCLFSRQPLDPTQSYKGHNFDTYIPIFTILQFVFYVGWLKVAEALINPWGEDVDDFEVNWFIDRHLQVSYAIVDDMHGKVPPLVKDAYWGKTEVQLPYTESAMDAKRTKNAPISVRQLLTSRVPVKDQRLSVPNHEPSSRRASLAGFGHPTTTNGNAAPMPFKPAWDTTQGFAPRRKSGAFLSPHETNNGVTKLNAELSERHHPNNFTLGNAHHYAAKPTTDGSHSSTQHGLASTARVTPQGGVRVYIDDSPNDSRRSSEIQFVPRLRPRSDALENIVEQSPSPPVSPSRDEDGTTPLIRPQYWNH